MKWESYEQKLVNFFLANKAECYSAILGRIKSNIHDGKMRVDGMMLIGLFCLVNKL